MRQSVTHFVLPTHLCGISISFSSYVRQSVAHFVLFLCGLFVFLFVGLLFFFFFSSVYVSQSVTRFSLVLWGGLRHISLWSYAAFCYTLLSGPQTISCTRFSIHVERFGTDTRLSIHVERFGTDTRLSSHVERFGTDTFILARKDILYTLTISGLIRALVILRIDFFLDSKDSLLNAVLWVFFFFSLSFCSPVSLLLCANFCSCLDHCWFVWHRNHALKQCSYMSESF